MLVYGPLLIHIIFFGIMDLTLQENVPKASYAERWILVRTCVDGKCQDQPTKPCLEPIEMQLYLKDFPPLRQNREYRSTERGLVIGKANYRVCEIDPIDFRYKMVDNACFHDVILNPAKPTSWTIMGEGVELMCKVDLGKDLLLIHYIFDRYSFHDLDRREYYRRLKQ